MTYCHECGEKIAEIDIFCPHCGISVPRAEGVSEDAQVSDQSTAPNDPDDSPTAFAAGRAKPEEPVSAEVPDIEVQSEVEPVSRKSFPTQEDHVSITAEHMALAADTLETPQESEEEVPNYPESLEAGEQANQESGQAGSDIIEETANSSERQPEQDSEPLTSSVAESEAENVAGDAPSVEETEAVPAFGDSEAASAEDFVNTIVYTPVTEKKLSDTSDTSDTDEAAEATESVPESESESVPESVPESVSVDDQEVLAAVTSENDKAAVVADPAELSDELSPAPDLADHSTVRPPINADESSSISKPDLSLEGDDGHPEVKSEFDSVRIMENEEPTPEESGEVADLGTETPEVDNTKEASAQTDGQDVVAEPAELPSDDQTRDSRSYTTPNIGSTETDGKRSKLKPLDEGVVLNSRYEIIRKIGGGGMGAVYLASDKNLGGVLRAVKEMVQSYIEEEQQEKAIQDFKRESLLLTSLEHQSIPTIYDYFYDDKEARFYLVMKYINGGDLSSRLRAAPGGRIDEASVTEWAIQIVDVLDYLHQRQPPIVYRDLKPANIMIDGNTGRVMLIDFGIARWINKEEKGVTAVGTMGYAPPELFSGNVEPSSDIYSLGSTMFHMLTGADPQSNPLLIFDFQKNPRPRQINPQLSDQMERILMRSVEYNADKRFSSAGAMLAELEQHFENLKSNLVTYGVKESPKPVALSNEKVFCGFCGQSIVASDLFCAFCGSKQPIAQQASQQEKFSMARLTARLEILGTSELESPAYVIEKEENLVGRRDPMSNIFPEVDLSKYDPQTKISRRHARIWRDHNNYLVEDLGSSNGTILMPVISDSFRLEPNKPHILTNGDKLKLGDTTLHFVLG